MDILQKYPYHFFIYGSRARGDIRKSSDLDLCFIEDIPKTVRYAMEEDFEESKLPYAADLLDWNKCDRSFQNRIKQDMKLISPAFASR